MNIEKSRGRNIVAMYIFSRNVYVNLSFLVFSNIQYFSNIYLSNISNIIIENSHDFNFLWLQGFLCSEMHSLIYFCQWVPWQVNCCFKMFTTKCMNSEARWLEFEFLFSQILAVWLWASCFNSMCLCVFIYRWE